MPAGPIEKWYLQQETTELLARIETEEAEALRDLAHFARNWSLDEAPARISHASGRRATCEALRAWLTNRVRLERAALQQASASAVTLRSPSMRTPDARPSRSAIPARRTAR